MKVKIKLISGSYFFVGSIALKRGEEVELDVDLLTNTEKVMLLRYDTPPSYFETSQNLFEVLKVKELCDLPPITEQTSKPYAILISNDGTSVSGYAEPKAVVTITDLSTSVEIAKVTADISGFFTTTLSKTIEDGESISVSAELPPKTQSDAVISIADLPLPAPSRLFIEGFDNLSGISKEGSTVIFEKQDETVPSILVDKSGEWKVKFTKPLFADMSVAIHATKGVKTSDKVYVSGDKLAPATPSNVVITKDFISGSNGLEDDVYIEFKDGSTVLADKVSGSSESFKHLLTSPVYAPDSIQLYGQKDLNGVPYKSATLTVVSEVQADLSVPSDFRWVSDVMLEGKTDAGTTVEGVTSSGLTAESLIATSGTFYVEFTKPLKVGETVTLVAKRGEVKSEPAFFEGEYVVADPTDVVISQDGVSISGKDLTDFKVNIKVNSKAAVEVVTVDWLFNYAFPTPLEDGDKVQVRSIDKYGNKSEYITYNFNKGNPNKDIEFNGFIYFSPTETTVNPVGHANPGDKLYLHLKTKNLVEPQEVNLEVKFKGATGVGSFETPKATIQANGLTILPLTLTSVSADTEMYSEVKIASATKSRSQEIKAHAAAIKPVYTPSPGPTRIPAEVDFSLNFTKNTEDYEVRTMEWASEPVGVEFKPNFTGLSTMAKIPASIHVETGIKFSATIDGVVVQHSTITVFDPYVPTNLVLSASGDVLTGSITSGVTSVLIYSKGLKVQTAEVSGTSFEITLDTPVLAPDFIEVASIFNGKESLSKTKVITSTD